MLFYEKKMYDGEGERGEKKRFPARGVEFVQELPNALLCEPFLTDHP